MFYLLCKYILEALVCSIIFTIISMLILRLLEERINVPCKCTNRLDGKTVLVTGGSSGIGLETARNLARRGTKLIITCINENTAKAAADELIATTGNTDIHYRQLDLASFDNIQRFAKNINDSFEELHILVNNAGVVTPGYVETEDGLEKTMQVNYIGTALLTMLLLPKLKTSKPSRIVTVSSKACKTVPWHDDPSLVKTSSLLKRYAYSKLGVLLWMKALSRRLPEGITVNVVHPGIAKTNIYVNNYYIPNAIFIFLLGKLFKTAEEGAQTSIHACVARSLEGVTGKYLSDCRISKIVSAFEDFEITEKFWRKTQSLIGRRLTYEPRI